MATRKQTYIHMYIRITRDSQCNHASVRLAQARPNNIVCFHGSYRSILQK